jgi:hypothetical protein
MPKTMDNVNNNTYLGTVYWSYYCIHQRLYNESYDKYAYSKLSVLIMAMKITLRMRHEALTAQLSETQIYGDVSPADLPILTEGRSGLSFIVKLDPKKTTSLRPTETSVTI